MREFNKGSKFYINCLVRIIAIVVVGLMLVGCGKDSKLEEDDKTERKSQRSELDSVISEKETNFRNDLITYLGMEVDTVDNEQSTLGYSAFVTDSTFEGSTARCITIVNNGYAVYMNSSQEGKYVNSIQIGNEDKMASVMGIYPGMSANEAIEILDKNNFAFSSIYDYHDEEKGECQYVYYEKNGVYQISFVVYSESEANPYGSLDEGDIHTEGTIGEIGVVGILADEFWELANDIGDRGWHNGMGVVESIQEECVELTVFTENKFFNIPGVNEYGTYIFGENVIVVDLQPGAGDYSYPTRITINDVCPYKLCGIYYNMDEESAMAQLSELGIVVRAEEENGILCDVDAYKTLEVRFEDGYVSFIECIDDYPEEHENRYIEY